MTECGYCKERESKIEKYEENIEKEKERECLKALEREKIANGMKCTRVDEIELRSMQKLQMCEKKFIEQSQADIDELWHRVLINDVRAKEENERATAHRLKQEMCERRMAYDAQIASANRQRQEALQTEREIENRRLERMKKKMEQDYYDAIKRKKDQQLTNKQNYIDGYQMKLSRIRSEKRQERDMDMNAIQIATEELRRENHRKLNQIKILKRQEDLFEKNSNRERMILDELKEETNRIARELKEQSEKENDELTKRAEEEKQNNKFKAAQEYKWHLEKRKHEQEIQRQERKATMDRVKRIAYDELRKNLDSANEELRRQNEYRKTLTNQIRDNQEIMELELIGMERKQRPFTKKAIMFKEAMEDKVGQLSTSKNPVHPFKKIMQVHKANNKIPSLPFINKNEF
ncbi:jg25159 [Pararge aegeria aegeria]|uniref:Jg25159 protein n=1 Tax=Pararge aegeria aegeria TaxID=348720 RepID=A0A8S4RYG8_9NEOP|nr:jg25159 [Pararge aegeria aegeria]